MRQNPYDRGLSQHSYKRRGSHPRHRGDCGTRRVRQERAFLPPQLHRLRRRYEQRGLSAYVHAIFHNEKHREEFRSRPVLLQKCGGKARRAYPSEKRTGQRHDRYHRAVREAGRCRANGGDGGRTWIINIESCWLRTIWILPS